MITNEAKINQLFTNLDTWRHLPNYQLERRADIFFSLYLAEVLQGQKNLGLDGELIIIPEFPCHHKTVFGEGTNHSFKIDYLAVTADGNKACFVELKTDNNSISADQIVKMERACEAGLYKLVSGVKTMHKASEEKPKYDQLRRLLTQVNNSDSLGMHPNNVFIIPNSLTDKEIKSLDVETQQIYKKATKITFEEYATIVEKHTDYLSLRFAKSLREWAKNIAGSPK